MERKKVPKPQKCEIRQTSTPLNVNKEMVSLIPFSNISTIRNTRKGIKNAVSDSPSILLWKPQEENFIFTNSRTALSKKRVKTRCDTPFKSQRSSQFSYRLAACSQKLKFFKGSGTFNKSPKLSRFEKRCDSTRKKNFLQENNSHGFQNCNKDTTEDGREIRTANNVRYSLRSYGGKRKLADSVVCKNSPSCINDLNARETSCKRSINSLGVLSENEYLEEECIHKHDTDETMIVDSNEFDDIIADAIETTELHSSFDVIERRRSGSIYSGMSSTIDSSFDHGILSDGYSMDSVEMEWEETDILSESVVDFNSIDRIDSSFQKEVDKCLKDDSLANIEPSPEIKIPLGLHSNADNLVADASKRSTGSTEAFHKETDTRESRRLNREKKKLPLDKQQIETSHPPNINEMTSAEKPNDFAQVKSSGQPGKNRKGYQSREKHERKCKQKKLDGVPLKGFPEKEIPSFIAGSGVVENIVDETGIFKKPLLSKKKSNNSMSIKRMFKKGKNGNKADREIASLYPPTSTPFDSPEIANQKLPLVFKHMSPVNMTDKGNCSLDDILITRINVRKTYAKSAKIRPRLKNSSARWESFAKHPPINKNNNYVSESSFMKRSNSYYLFESPPIGSTEHISIDDLSNRRFKSVKATKLSTRGKKSENEYKAKKWYDTSKLQELAIHFEDISKMSLVVEKKRRRRKKIRS